MRVTFYDQHKSAEAVQIGWWAQIGENAVTLHAEWSGGPDQCIGVLTVDGFTREPLHPDFPIAKDADGRIAVTDAPAPTVTQAVEVKWPRGANYGTRWSDGWNAARRDCIAAYDAALAQAPAPAGETDAEVLRKAAGIWQAAGSTTRYRKLLRMANRIEAARPSPDRETA